MDIGIDLTSLDHSSSFLQNSSFNCSVEALTFIHLKICVLKVWICVLENASFFEVKIICVYKKNKCVLQKKWKTHFPFCKKSEERISRFAKKLKNAFPVLKKNWRTHFPFCKKIEECISRFAKKLKNAFPVLQKILAVFSGF